MLSVNLSARKAGAYLVRISEQRSALEVIRKGPNDFVSNAGNASENLILEQLRGRFRNDRFVV